MPTALVTGATSGIGATFAAHLAARGDDLVLVARTPDRLAETAERLRANHHVAVEVLAADLADRAEVNRVAARLADPDRPIDLLVNNAGFGIHAKLLDPEVIEEIDRGYEVMVRAVMVLAGAAGRSMVARGSGAIVNVASTAGFMTMGAYSALKDAVTVYTESLANELRHTPVTATALCPGYVRTEFHQRAGIGTGQLPGLAWVDPDELVADCLADVAKKRVVSIPSARYKVGIALVRLAPRSWVRRVSAALGSTR